MPQAQPSSDLTVDDPGTRVRRTRVSDVALEIYKDPDRATEFLACPHPMLDGRTPFEMASSDNAGADAVAALLGRGAYSGGV